MLGISRNQAITVLVVLAATLTVLALAGAGPEAWVPGAAVLGAVAALSVMVLRVQNALLREMRRLSITNKRADQRTQDLMNASAKKHEASDEALTAVQRQITDLRSSTKAWAGAAAQDREHLLALRKRMEEAEQKILSSNTRGNIDVVRQVESLLQLYPRTVSSGIPMPPTGGFALDAHSLLHLLHLVRSKRPTRIVEIGSGTSTIWVGHLCQELGIEMVSIDHLESYAKKTRDGLERHGLSGTVDLRLAPLQALEVEGETFNWYDIDAFSDLQDVDLLLIDGPPKATGPRARFPALPVLRDRLSPEATIILDDTNRKDEADILDSWRTHFPEFIPRDQGLSRLGVLTRGAAGRPEV